MKHRNPIAAGIVALAVGLATASTMRGQEDTLKIDFTIMLEGPIAKDGGALILLPIETPVDAGLQDRPEPIEAQIEAQGRVSIVRLKVPEGGTYSYRFRSANERLYPSTDISTDRISVGSGKGFHPESADTEELPTILTHFISVRGGTWSEGDTRRARATAELGFLEQRYPCVESEFALSCDATPAKQDAKE